MKKTLLIVLGVLIVLIVAGGIWFFVDKDTTKKECLERGGIWGKGGLMLMETCNLPTSDGGRVCTDFSQCEGSCVGKNTDSTVGECSEWKIILGCNVFLRNGRAETICVD